MFWGSPDKCFGVRSHSPESPAAQRPETRIYPEARLRKRFVAKTKAVCDLDNQSPDWFSESKRLARRQSLLPRESACSTECRSSNRV
eukprot:3916858-Rhodomonas_salina.1